MLSYHSRYSTLGFVLPVFIFWDAARLLRLPWVYYRFTLNTASLIVVTFVKVFTRIVIKFWF